MWWCVLISLPQIDFSAVGCFAGLQPIPQWMMVLVLLGMSRDSMFVLLQSLQKHYHG